MLHVPKGRTTQIDDDICVEFLTYTVLNKNMIHGPYRYLNPNSPCIKDWRLIFGTSSGEKDGNFTAKANLRGK